jgi:hypothetical protein
MTDPSTNERRPPLHVFQPAHRKATWWLAAIVGYIALPLAIPAVGHAEESNPNNLNCLGSIAAGQAEVGSEEQQVRYSFYCNGPITGYQLQAQIPVTGIGAQPLVSALPAGTPLTETFSCSGEVPGYALNCVGAAKSGYHTITGQFAIGSKLCKEPRVDPLLTVTYASAIVEKGAAVITQAISGPFDLGRPTGCRPDAHSGGDRLNPKAPIVGHKKVGKSGGNGKTGKKPASKKPAKKK